MYPLPRYTFLSTLRVKPNMIEITMVVYLTIFESKTVQNIRRENKNTQSETTRLLIIGLMKRGHNGRIAVYV